MEEMPNKSGEENSPAAPGEDGTGNFLSRVWLFTDLAVLTPLSLVQGC